MDEHPKVILSEPYSYTGDGLITPKGLSLIKPSPTVGHFKSKHLQISLAAVSKPRWLTRLMIKWLFEFEWIDV